MLTERQLLTAQPVIRRIVLGFPNAGEAEDLKQTVLLHLWAKRSLFTGDDREAEHFIARVAHRACINAARHRQCERDTMALFIPRDGGSRAANVEATKLEATRRVVFRANSTDPFARGVATPEETLLAKEALGIFAAQMQKRAANKNPTQALYRARQATAKALSL